MRRLFVLAALLFALPAHAFTITLIEYTPEGGDPQSTSLVSYAMEAGGLDLDFAPTSLPFVDSHRAASGDAVAETSYALSNSALEITVVEHSRSYLGGSSSSNGAVYFIVDRDVDYSIAGEYSVQAPTASQEIQLYATLSGGGEVLFDNRQWTTTSLSETLTLGEERGAHNRENLLVGSLTGTLVAGTPYRWSYIASSWGVGAATGSGFLTLAFIPEPSTALLLAAGLAGLAAAGRRR